MAPGNDDSTAPIATNASPFWIMLLLSFRASEHGMIRIGAHRVKVVGSNAAIVAPAGD